MDIPTSTDVIWLYGTIVMCIGVGLIALNIFAIKITLRRRAREKYSQALAAQQRLWEDHVGAGQRTSSLTGSITSGKA